MKKLIITIAVVLGLGFSTFAQDAKVENRGLFGRGEGFHSNRDMVLPGLPQSFVSSENSNAITPLGSGIAVLASLGAAYMVAKKRKEE